ncbi:MAG: multidrug ABC transporter ATP-binding protein, partial [Lachnospiraceae bacterium]|nr:multidrug ABC transporter ATP-binding protein [Lachnospiraceae bacterium]
MSDQKGQKLAGRNIPGMMNRNQRFAEVQHAENVGAALKHIGAYFAKEKVMVAGMLAVVVFGTLCGVYAPSLQSNAIDMIAKTKDGNLTATLVLMIAVYLFYSAGQLLQGLISARLSQRIVKRMREELFDKLMDLPIRYLDTHSHGDVMSRMTND